MNSPVHITDKAYQEIVNIMENKNIPEGYGLRMGVRGGGCSVSFILGFDKEKDQDQVYQLEGVSIFIQKKELMFLIGKEVDFYDGSDARGFVFVTPEVNLPK
ncbi:MAG: iron-sulfur cluster assembly protein [Marinoscillum sp.]|jgi:iron-sulfur cluster assembly protein